MTHQHLGNTLSRQSPRMSNGRWGKGQGGKGGKGIRGMRGPGNGQGKGSGNGLGKGLGMQNPADTVSSSPRSRGLFMGKINKRRIKSLCPANS